MNSFLLKRRILMVKAICKINPEAETIQEVEEGKEYALLISTCSGCLAVYDWRCDQIYFPCRM